MNRKTFLTRLIVTAAGFPTWLTSCSKLSSSARDQNVDYYTCTMHPSVRSQDPNGKCPICSMDLVPVIKKGATAQVPGNPPGGKGTPEEPSTFTVPVQRQQQIGVTYATITSKPLQRSIRTVGTVSWDKTRYREFVARVDGYIQDLEISSPGEPVSEGQPLLTIYSPDLSTAERELVNLLGTRDHTPATDAALGSSHLIEAARRRLEQWGITPEQIADLEKSRKPSEYLTLRSPFRGVVLDVPVDQGRKVMSGDRLAAVADLSQVWIYADFYEDDLPLLSAGKKVQIRAKSYPAETFEGKLSLISPTLSAMTRTAKARIDITNTDLKLRPGMYVDVELSTDIVEGLAVPVSAVMPTGLRTLVFVDRGEGKLEPRPIELGQKYGDDYQVISGLKEGERVVASANFLIDAESKVQGALKSFEQTATRPGQK